MKRITIEVTDELKAALDARCEDEGRTLKWLVREALIEAVEDWEDAKACEAAAQDQGGYLRMDEVQW